MQTSDWKDIEGYEGRYKISIYGEILRVYKSKTVKMKPAVKDGWYVTKLLGFDGIRKMHVVHTLVAKAFLPPKPNGCVLHHKNGSKLDNFYMNIEWIRREKLGQLTGAKSRRQAVFKLGKDGVVDIYTSAREAARKNYMSYQTIIDRCNGKVKSLLAPDGFAYEWADDERMRKRVKKYKPIYGTFYKGLGVTVTVFCGVATLSSTLFGMADGLFWAVMFIPCLIGTVNMFWVDKANARNGGEKE